MYFAVATIYNTTIDNNLVYIVNDFGGAGGGMHIHCSEVTMRNTIISNNVASNGGGLYIEDRVDMYGGSTTVTPVNHHLSIMMQLVMVMKYIHRNHQLYH